MLSTALLLTASMVVGQTEESATYEHLKDLDCLVGDWLCAQEVEESAAESETLKEFVGKKATIKMSIKWVAGHGAQNTDMVLDFAGKFEIKMRMLTGWNPIAEKITGCSFTNRGGCWTHVWSKEDGNWVDDYEGVNLDGERQKGRRIFVLDGKDQLTIRSIETIRGDRVLPDEDLVFTRL